MKRTAASLSVALLLGALALSASLKSNGTVEIARLNAMNWDEFAPAGKEVDAIYGDFVIRNEHLTAVIAQPIESRHANLTVRDVGGCLIDLTVRDPQSDQLSAYYPGARAFAYRSAEVLDSNGSPVELSDGALTSPASASVRVRSEGNDTRPAVDLTYQLASGAKYVTVISKFTNESQKPQSIPLEDSLRADAQKDEIVKAPNGSSDLFWFHDRYWGQAYGIESSTLKVITNNSGQRDSTLRYENADGERKLELAPGQSYTLIRRVFPGHDLPHVRAIAAENRSAKVTPILFQITDANAGPIAQARLLLKRGDSEWGSLSTQADGHARSWLPAGEYSVSASVFGVELKPEASLSIFKVNDQVATQRVEIQYRAWRAGVVQAKITDGAGAPIPCKLEFLAKPGTSQPNFAPESGDFAAKSLCYAPLGELNQELPPGDYEVVISHGPEYDALFRDITVAPGQTVRLTGQLPRTVDTTGWISSDFHSHSSPSGDNTGSQLGRVLNLLCDHIEFAPCTEHNRIDSYEPHIKRLGVQHFIGTCTGMELTGNPLPLNHQNAFPLVMKPHLQDGGGPVTDGDVETQVERLALWDNRSEKLVQINHADLGWLLRDKNGDGRPDEGHSRILPFVDVFEVHPIPDILTLDPYLTASEYKSNNRIFNWLQYLNQGQRFVGVVNTDAHYNYHESGWLRNWIKSPTDEPPQVKPLDIVRAAEAGAVIMSNGPFLSVRVAEAGRSNWVIAGQDLAAPSKKLVIDVKVQCPNWLEIDRVFVLVNGRIDERHHYRKDSAPDKFRSGPVRFAEKLELDLQKDAHIIVAAGAEKSTLGKVHGPTWGKHHPAAFNNPVFVDVDGNGFQANGDTLGYPLPVKFQPPKK